MNLDNTYQQVQDHYGSLARAKSCRNYSSTVAKAFGYSEDELNSIPTDANLGLSCGNPLAIASLREGEIVIDLGSGAGFDVFLASKKLGPRGRAIGVDRNTDMLIKACENKAKWPGTENIYFVHSNITSIPLEDGIADCVISNCVINLVPDDDKPKVFAEMGRLLKSGGRVAISDILARNTLTPELRESAALYVGCVAGASLKAEYEKWLSENGFDEITIVDAGSDLNVYINTENAPGCCDQTEQDTDASASTKADCCGKDCCGKTDSDKLSCCDASKTAAMKLDLANVNVNEWVGSFKIFAVKK